MTQAYSEIRDSAVIVCEHIHNHSAGILSAYRTKPVRPEDSGWAFYCGEYEHENPDNAKVWLLREIVEHEPSLRKHVCMDPDLHIWRPNDNAEWIIDPELSC